MATTGGSAAPVPPDLTGQLRAKGYRLTPARQLVLGAVAALEHATPDAICAEVQRTASSVNLSTVYRTLELLEELGLVSHTHLGHGAPIYHAAHEREHLHLVCGSCGRVLESPSECASTLVAQLRADYGFETDIAHFALYGRCAECRAASGENDPGENDPIENGLSVNDPDGNRPGGNNHSGAEG